MFLEWLEAKLNASRMLPAEALALTKAEALRLMAQHGLHGWVFRFNNNLRRAGVCYHPHADRPGRIELSRHFVLRNVWSEVIDTILHEIAHALVGVEHGHDAVWKATCRALGARPERCYGANIAMPRGKWLAICPACRREYDRHRRPKRLTGWFCRPCGPQAGTLRWQRLAYGTT